MSTSALSVPVPTNRELKELCARHGIDTSSALERADLIALAQPCPPTLTPTPAPIVAAPGPSSAGGSALGSAAVLALSLGHGSGPRPAPLPSTEPAAPSLHVRKAYRDVDGAFDGDTDDSDEEHAADGGFRPSKRPRPGSSSPSRGHDGSRVWLLPRAGPTVTVVATADLHRHHEDRYIDHDSKNLAEWFASDAPAHVDVVLFAGDLGLELSTELSGRSRGKDRPASGARETPHEQDARTVATWNRLLRAMLAARPGVHVVIIAGNHDGLLCLRWPYYTYYGHTDYGYAYHPPCQATMTGCSARTIAASPASTCAAVPARTLGAGRRARRRPRRGGGSWTASTRGGCTCCATLSSTCSCAMGGC